MWALLPDDLYLSVCFASIRSEERKSSRLICSKANFLFLFLFFPLDHVEHSRWTCNIEKSFIRMFKRYRCEYHLLSFISLAWSISSSRTKIENSQTRCKFDQSDHFRRSASTCSLFPSNSLRSSRSVQILLFDWVSSFVTVRKRIHIVPIVVIDLFFIHSSS